MRLSRLQKMGRKPLLKDTISKGFSKMMKGSKCQCKNTHTQKNLLPKGVSLDIFKLFILEIPKHTQK